jgi:fumarylacetoacetate (FAA) hydrolase
MKLTTYSHKGKENFGFVFQDRVFDLRSMDGRITGSMNTFLRDWDSYLQLATAMEQRVREFPALVSTGLPMSEIEWLAPVPRPPSLRDGYAFRQHVAAARRNRSVPMIPQFDQYPVFYFGNHRSVVGPGKIICMPDHFDKLDFELEVAGVICRRGRNIKAQDADEYIGGLMIMNDLSARTLQMEEMLLNLGPAKGKDFATALGPWLVTLDELKPFEVLCKANHTGMAWNLKMSAAVNGKQVSEGNLSDMDWTFAEIIERASYGADLYPGDVIGSGTVGTGCLVELNGTAKLNFRDYEEQWLEPGDEITLSVDGLGDLSNTLVKEDDDFSILKQKKNPDPA